MLSGYSALPTTDTAPASLLEGQTDDLLDILATHNGRAGDTDLELVTLELFFEETAGDPLSSAEANALIANLHIYLDDGSNTFESGSDTLVTTVASLSLTAGAQTVTFTDGDSNVQVAQGTPERFFVVTELTADAADQVPNNFLVTHRTGSSSTAEDRDNDIPLTLEFAADASSSLVVVATLVPSGTNVSDSAQGGSTVPGGINFTFADTTGGTFTAQYTTVPVSSIQVTISDPGSINFGIPTDPVQLWEINYDETLTDTLTIVFGYEDLNLASGFTESQFAIFLFHSGAWSRPSQTINTGNKTITVTTSVLSQFVLGADVATSSTWDFFGTAEGGTVDFTVGVVSLQVVTTAGQTPAQVAAAVAAAINGDPTLSGEGITATADGNTVTTNGSFTSREINDPGFFDVDPSIPTLSGPGLLLFLLLAAAGFVAVRRRRRAASAGSA